MHGPPGPAGGGTGRSEHAASDAMCDGTTGGGCPSLRAIPPTLRSSSRAYPLMHSYEPASPPRTSARGALGPEATALQRTLHARQRLGEAHDSRLVELSC